MNTKLILNLATLAGLLALVAGLLLGHSAESGPAVVVPPAAVAVPAPPVRAVAPPARRVDPPTRIEIPAIGVDAALTGRGLGAGGAFDTPPFGRAAWYDAGPRPGEPGGAVVVAHVHGPDGPDLFWELAALAPGDLVRVHRPRAVAVFVVDSVEDAPKTQLPYERIWPATARRLLRLITCGGTRTAAGYPDNTIVFAHLHHTEPA